MNVQLDKTLIYLTRRRTRKDAITPEERIQINLLWRKKIRIPVLVKVFQCSRNAIYYKALTGKADSYPNSSRSNSADETNAVIEKLGEEEAWNQFMTDDVVRKVNAENKKEADRRARRW